MLGFYVYVLDKNRRDIFMNILFYFDRQINPERGGTERVTYNLAHYFQGKRLPDITRSQGSSSPDGINPL